MGKSQRNILSLHTRRLKNGTNGVDPSISVEAATTTLLYRIEFLEFCCCYSYFFDKPKLLIRK